MSYQLNKNSETQENQEESWYVRGWGNYETTSGDGGFLDSFNALKQQMDFVANQYRVQMESMAQRKQDMLKDIRDNIWITVGLALGPFLYNLFVLLLMHISVYSGLLSIICIFLEIAEIPLFIVCEFYILPGQIRRLGNRLWQKKVLNSGPELAEYRKKHGIISFEDERMFLEEKLQEYDNMCKEIEEMELDKSNGVFSMLYAGDTDTMAPAQVEVLDRMRTLTVMQECRASVTETRKEIGPGWLIVGFSIFMIAISVILIM